MKSPHSHPLRLAHSFRSAGSAIVEALFIVIGLSALLTAISLLNESIHAGKLLHEETICQRKNLISGRSGRDAEYPCQRGDPDEKVHIRVEKVP